MTQNRMQWRILSLLIAAPLLLAGCAAREPALPTSPEFAPLALDELAPTLQIRSPLPADEAVTDLSIEIETDGVPTTEFVCGGVYMTDSPPAAPFWIDFLRLPRAWDADWNRTRVASPRQRLDDAGLGNRNWGRASWIRDGANLPSTREAR